MSSVKSRLATPQTAASWKEIGQSDKHLLQPPARYTASGIPIVTSKNSRKAQQDAVMMWVTLSCMRVFLQISCDAEDHVGSATWKKSAGRPGAELAGSA